MARSLERRSQSIEKATRDRLLESAVEVFADRGYHGVTVDDIVAASGTSKGAFYHYFPSKRGIFLILMDDLAGMVERGVEFAIAGEDGALRKVDAALRVVFETVTAQRSLAKILLIEAVGLGPDLEQKRLEIHRRFAAVIRQHLDRAVLDGSIPGQDTGLASIVWIGALNEVIAQWLIANGASLADRLPPLRVMLLRSIGVDVVVGAAVDALGGNGVD